MQTCKLTTSVTSLRNELDIDQTLRRFWELENTYDTITNEQQDDEAEIHFKKTVKRDNQGKYVVELPFSSPRVPVGNNYQSALNRLYSMERRFQKDTQHKDLYKQFMREYLALNHMEEIPVDQIESEYSCYLPHHSVLKTDSSTTKLRVVFDGSVKSSTGNSLNDGLLTGPSIQRDLFSVCILFRIHKFVFTADIEKMYRQIWVSREHQDYQRILWRDSQTEPVKHYRLRTVTYGTSCAPFLAIRVLHQIAQDYADIYPRASKVLLHHCYVDDVMAGQSTIEDIISLKTELMTLLQQCGFNLRKWSSNCWSLLSSIPNTECEFAAIDFDDDTKSIKALGLRWYPSVDSFSFNVSLPTHKSICRRTILSDSSRIFDPLGFLTPVTVRLKMLFQSLWLSDLTWDDTVSEPYATQWKMMRDDLECLSNLRIPRWLHVNSSEIELHGFSDASKQAYAAVLYCRSQNKYNSVQIHLVAAKSKVAPLKEVSLPRLELLGALLLSRLVNLVLKSLESYKINIYTWIDSQIVLYWLSSPPRRWKPFIANRTSEILDILPRSCWNYVPSKQNPADCASRGISASKLLDNTLWWNGPLFLQQPSALWPKWKPPLVNLNNTNLEERKETLQLFTANLTNDLISTLISQNSRWIRLLRVVAWCLRFISNVRNRTRLTCTLTSTELQQSKVICLRYVQHVVFREEIRCLKSNLPLKCRSQLKRLTPFLDKENVLRVGGRIANSDLPFDVKHPILLPSSHSITTLIIRHLHLRHLHAGISELITLARQQYWIIGVRSIVRKIVFNCTICFRHKQKTTNQLMGQLPIERVTYSKPFVHVGCDYAGPISLRLCRGRKSRFVKGYICVFVCMTIKAIHLELVGDLTTDAFLAALRRFIARRGKCAKIFSDNGTNFKGAHRELAELHQLFQSEIHVNSIQDQLSQDGIEWSFIPPASPHFGGLWEAGVKSVKTHLRRVLTHQIITYEEMYTVLTQIEALLNSRPICQISQDHEYVALTPFHFLTGSSYSAIPEPNLQTVKFSHLSNWQLLQNMVQGFWKKWHMEYLTSLQQLPKWFNKQPDIRRGDLVLIKEANIPPAKWPMAIIESIHPGTDGLTRVVTLRTASGTFIRPIVKIVKLPNQDVLDTPTRREDVEDLAALLVES